MPVWRCFYLGKINVAADEIAVHENRRCADFHDHVEYGEKALRGGDHFVARTDAGKLECHLDRGGRGGQYAHGTPAAKGGQLRLEPLHPGPARDMPGAQNLAYARDGRFVEQRTREF